jgi:hypothetical protein
MQEEFTIKQAVPLMLKVSDIQPYDTNNKIFPYDKVVSNTIGTILQCVTNVAWNINLQEVLGDLYDQYDYFNLEVLQIMTVPMTGGNGTTLKPMDNSIYLGYRNLNVLISGLQWLRSSYDVQSGNETGTVHLCNISDMKQASDNASAGPVYRGDRYIFQSQRGYMNYDLCFRKERDVKINIRFGAIDSGLDYCPASIFANGTITIMHHFSIKFNITPFK